MSAAVDAPATGRIAVDWTRCDGHGLCAALRPERFALDEWGFPLLRDADVRPADEPGVRALVSACPALALRLERTTR
jgi:ferredoxin